MLIAKLLKSIGNLLAPPRCGACGNPLLGNESCICHKCLAELPRTNMHRLHDNSVAQIFWGRIPLERATSYLYFSRGGRVQRFIHRMKYSGHKEYGYMIGRLMATELQPDGFFDGIDAIIPIPLHRRKERQRGYNQSEMIARGISDVTGIPLITDAVERTRYTETQTHKSRDERHVNVGSAFRFISKSDFTGRHILLIDDVLTTGATTIACAEAFLHIPDIRFSVLTLAKAR